MDEARTDKLTFAVALRLGRVSNVPTVWTNVAAGVALSGAAFPVGIFAGLVVALSLFYIGGMYLNDAFDREIDARERPERPIPSGIVSAGAVFAVGFGLMVAGWLMLVAIGYGPDNGTDWRAPLAGALLGAAIVVYDLWHKANPISPVIMGLCRLLVYITAAVAGLLAAAAFLAWLGYSMFFLLKPDRVNVPRAVVSLIAGLCLLDAVFIAAAGQLWLALLAAVAFLLTLALQRHIPGT